MSRAVARPRSRVVRPDAGDRLALVEFLLGCDDAADCAQRAVDWLGTHAGARQVLCLAADEASTRLTALAARGIAPSRAARVASLLDRNDHPFAATIAAGGGPAIVSPNGRPAPMPLGSGPLLTVPLPPPAHLRSDGRPGLLVVKPVTADLERETRWLAELLGPKLARLRGATLTAAPETLERERTLLDTIINAVPDPVLLTDPEGRMILANARAEMLFATTERESEGRRRAVALNNMLFSAALAGRTIDATEPSRRELLLVDPTEGSDLLFELLSAVVGDSRQAPRVLSVLRNVTDLRTAVDELEENLRKLRLAEADARAERDRLDLIIDAVADPIVVSDPAGAIALMNAPAERLFTAAPEASNEATLRVQSNDAHFSSFVSNLMFAGDTLRYSGGVSLTEPTTGRPLPVEAVAGKVLSGHGELMGVVTILHDQTEALEKQRLYEQVKRASEQLEERVREATGELVHQNELLRRQAIQLEHASALKSQFLANMSHEFRTPLNAILGYTSILLQGVSGELTPLQRRSLTRVDSSGRHLLALIDDILDISRIEAGKMPLHVTEFTLAGLVAEVMAEVEPIIARTTLTVTKALAPDLPAVRSDRQKVKQIVLNFLTNALKFTLEGWVKVTAGVDARADRFLIAVADTGIGIAEHDQAKVFEDFSQADNSSTRAYGGAGLGLAICRRLASMLGGQITLQSKLGRGSTFTLSLPGRLAT
ncbi:MAG TPA: ATP-binding protein [Methylomirabilota bacterium]|nr:ATP-binding protein [Methylomirabilota bacterium]